MDWITIYRQGQQRRVRPHGLDYKLAQGWTTSPGADQAPEQPKTAQASPRTTRKKS